MRRAKHPPYFNEVTREMLDVLVLVYENVVVKELPLGINGVIHPISASWEQQAECQ